MIAARLSVRGGSPNLESQLPTGAYGPNTMSSKIPDTDGGSASGSCTRRVTNVLPRKSQRAKRYESGTPNNNNNRLVTGAVSADAAAAASTSGRSMSLNELVVTRGRRPASGSKR